MKNKKKKRCEKTFPNTFYYDKKEKKTLTLVFKNQECVTALLKPPMNIVLKVF